MVRKHRERQKKLTFQSFCKIRKIPSPSGAGEELQGGQEAHWHDPPSWPRRAPSWQPRTPPPTPPRLGTFLLLQKCLLYICPDRPGSVSRDFVCFLSRSVSARKTFSRLWCHGFSKFPQVQVRRQRHQPLPRRGEEAPPGPSCRGWCPPQGRSKGASQRGEHRRSAEGDGTRGFQVQEDGGAWC